MKKQFFVLGTALMLSSCNQQAPVETEEDTLVKEVQEVVEVEPSLELLWESDTSLTTNESVLPHGGILYVSNISGQPTEKDGIGFISKLSDDGKVEVLEWVKGLNAPKGMGIMDGKMYVTDITDLVEIDMESGKILNNYPVEGAEFLNDVAVGDGSVYFSDMNTGKLHVFEDGTVSTLAQGHDELNGLAVANGKLYGLDSKGLHQINLDGTQAKTINSEVTGGDGLVVIDENTFVASRWVGEIWFIKDGKATMLLDSKGEDIQTADIGYISETNTLLVPRFFGDKVSAYRLKY